MSKQRWRFVWGGGLVLFGLINLGYSLLTYRGPALRTYLVTAALVLAGFLVVTLSERRRQRRTKMD